MTVIRSGRFPDFACYRYDSYALRYVLHLNQEHKLIYSGSPKIWCEHGLLHRENSPAQVFSDGSEYWFRYGELHRLDGPAIHFPGHPSHGTWYFEGQNVPGVNSIEEFLEAVNLLKVQQVLGS